MAKLIISRDGQVVQQVELVKERTSLGRHPGNDIVLDHATVSGRHAAITRSGTGVAVEDLGSTNGTWVNGQRTGRRQLADRDRLVVAVFQLEFVDGPWRQEDGQLAPGLGAGTRLPSSPASEVPAAGAPASAGSGAEMPAAGPAAQTAASAAPPAHIAVLSGPHAGKKLALTKPLTTLGSPGSIIVVVSRQGPGYYLSHMEGSAEAALNGAPIVKEPRRLAHGDQLTLAGTHMSFLLDA